MEKYVFSIWELSLSPARTVCPLREGDTSPARAPCFIASRTHFRDRFSRIARWSEGGGGSFIFFFGNESIHTEGVR